VKASVGLIGLGLMGRPMAANLLKAGFSLAVHTSEDLCWDFFASAWKSIVALLKPGAVLI